MLVLHVIEKILDGNWGLVFKQLDLDGPHRGFHYHDRILGQRGGCGQSQSSQTCEKHALHGIFLSLLHGLVSLLDNLADSGSARRPASRGPDSYSPPQAARRQGWGAKAE